MEKAEISRHEVAVYHTLWRSPGTWLTNTEVAVRSGVAPRTARLHTFRFVKLGLIDQIQVFPSYRYRLSDSATRSNPEYLSRLRTAASAFGIDLNGDPDTARSQRA